MNNEEFKEYFIDLTFKLILKKFKNYKLLTIASIDNEENKTLLIR